MTNLFPIEFPRDFVTNFGPEGRVEFQKKNAHREELSKEELNTAILSAAHSIHNARNSHWVLAAKQGLILNQALGDKASYDLKSDLHYLRTKSDKSLQDKLVQRVISLLLIDLVASDPPFLDPVVVFGDLHFDEPDIRPEGRESAAVGFVSFRLFENDAIRYRLHVYPDRSFQDIFPHDHYGNSGSVILAGSLVNQFFRVQETTCENAHFPLYNAVRSGTMKRFSRQKWVSLEVISSHCYTSGNRYVLPAPEYLGFLPSFSNLRPHELTFHQVGVKPGTVTLFQQHKDHNFSQTTFNFDDPAEVVKPYTLDQAIPDLYSQKLAMQASKSVMNEAMCKENTWKQLA